ncbi:hypothetical protein PNOK_0303200 [Pyrrhoderma noxium]|uniref:Uncharacterized protein n=1 Tax=Pyrrhoderma noxium TaxID=2282107 RepID=A0A286ULS5_9AGAM|nr:hypothetical protein PNOK_0303200 [Pyrrhoderma noxium]
MCRSIIKFDSYSQKNKNQTYGSPSTKLSCCAVNMDTPELVSVSSPTRRHAIVLIPCVLNRSISMYTL